MGNNVYRLEEICDIKSGKRIPKGMDYVTFKTNYPYIRARDIKEGKINTGDLIYLEENVYKKALPAKEAKKELTYAKIPRRKLL